MYGYTHHKIQAMLHEYHFHVSTVHHIIIHINFVVMTINFKRLNDMVSGQCSMTVCIALPQLIQTWPPAWRECVPSHVHTCTCTYMYMYMHVYVNTIHHACPIESAQS